MEHRCGRRRHERAIRPLPSFVSAPRVVDLFLRALPLSRERLYFRSIGLSLEFVRGDDWEDKRGFGCLGRRARRRV